MSSNFEGNPLFKLPETYIIPEEDELKDIKLRQYFNEIASEVNVKSSGIFDAVETISGNLFFPTFSTQTASSATYRTVFRKVIDTGALPNATTKNVAHGITFGANDTMVHLYGTATDPTQPRYLPLPFSTPAGLTNQIALSVDGTNVVIQTGLDRTSFTRSFVVLEWIKTT